MHNFKCTKSDQSLLNLTLADLEVCFQSTWSSDCLCLLPQESIFCDFNMISDHYNWSYCYNIDTTDESYENKTHIFYF